MFNLILVDDEPIVLKGIQTVFKLDKYGFILVKTYSNPIQALAELDETKPDLIITDIKMPQMDGLHFSAEVKKRRPEAEIVILSGHDNFSFAQAAVRLGASDYLLKPIKKLDFIKMLENAYSRLNQKASEKAKNRQLEEAAKVNYSILRNRFFERLLNGSTLDDHELCVLYNQLGFVFENSPFVLIKFVIYEISVEDDYMSTVESIITEAKGLFSSDASIEEFYTDEYLYLFLYDFKNVIFSEEELHEKVIEYKYKKQRQGIRLLCGISDIYKGISLLPAALTECDEGILSSQKNHLTNKTAINSLYTENSDLHIPYSDIEALFLSISTHDKPKIAESIQAIYELPAVSLYRDFGLSVTLMILIKMGHIQNKYKPENIFITQEMISINYLSSHYNNTPQLKDFIHENALRLSALIEEQEINAPSKTILSALRYIDEHYSENISLSDVAGAIYISKNYLCDLFKKEMNITFIDYVTNLRIEKAKQLLSCSDKKMYEISEAVGYNDYAYFSQIFKRHTGTTLSNYRKQH